MEPKLNCQIITPREILYEGDADYVVVQAHDGKRGFLSRHATMATALGIGEIKFMNGNTTELFFIEKGLVDIVSNKLTVLAESAKKKEELIPIEIKNKIKNLIKRDLEASHGEKSLILDEISRLKIKLKIALKWEAADKA